MNHISFADFDDLQTAFESKQEVSLDRFRAMVTSTEDADGESARVTLHARDGNDYAIIDTGSSYFLIVLTNIPTTQTGDIIVFAEYRDLRSCVTAMSEITITDNER